jgi:hypothetical protein
MPSLLFILLRISASFSFCTPHVALSQNIVYRLNVLFFLVFSVACQAMRLKVTQGYT